MKISSNISKAIFALFITGSLALYVSSCKKDASSSVSATVTEADAAELTTDAVSPATGGLVVQVNSSVSIYKTVALSCGVQKDSSLTKSSLSGATPSYNYSLKWTYLLTCNGLIPNQLAFNFTGSSSYDGLRMSSTDNSTGGFTLTGLPATSSQYVFNASYARSGSQTSKIGNQKTFSSSLQIQSANLTVDKTSQQIVSGTATVSISGTSSSGNSFNFNGTITFLGGNKATLLLTSGTSYTIQW